MRVIRKKDVINAVKYDGDQEVIIEEIQKIITDDQTVEPSRDRAHDILVHGFNHKQAYIDVTVQTGEWFVIRGDGKFESLMAHDFNYNYVEG